MNKHTYNILDFNRIREIYADCTTSSLGRERALAIEPVTGFGKVEALQEETSAARKVLIEEADVPLGGIRDIRDSLRRLEIESLLEPREFLDIAQTVRTARRLKVFFADEERVYPVIENIVNNLSSFKSLEQKILRCIDDQGKLRDSASSRLRSIRRKTEETEKGIRSRLNQILNSRKYRNLIQEQLVTIRDNRYVIPIKAEGKKSFPGIVHDRSASGATIFVEPLTVVEDNNELRSLRREEEEEIRRILRELGRDTAQRLDDIRRTLRILVGLDLIFARAELSLTWNAVSPDLNHSRYISIKEGRHPLLGEDAVPIDLYLGDEFSTLVITGPNTGGKTVTLKTVGLFALLTQCGFHLPAEVGTQMPVFRHILGDIGDEQSIEQNLSTFSSHLNHIIEIIATAEERSLVLLDEIGAGTDPTEGSALAMALLEYFHSTGSLTVATTHYSQLKAFAYEHENIENASVEFDVETLRPTYRLLMGTPGKSNAFEIAQRLGLPAGILKRAREFLSDDEIRVSDMIQSLEEDSRTMEHERRWAEQFRSESEELRDTLAAERKELKQKKEELLIKAQREAEEVVKDAQSRVEELVHRLRVLEKKREKELENLRGGEIGYESEEDAEEIMSEVQQEIRNMKSRTQKKQEELSPSNDEVVDPGLEEGQRVYIPEFDREGEVLSVNGTGKKIQVQVGAMKLNLGPGEVRPLDNENKTGKTPKRGRVSFTSVKTNKVKNTPPELHIRGLRVDEALHRLDKYIDNACLAGLREVRIIHGKGTGTLREVVQKRMDEHPSVESYRLGSQGEGGYGATVVRLS